MAERSYILTIKEILLSGSGLLLILMTLVQIAPIKINPWSALAKAIGKAINADVSNRLDGISGPRSFISTMNCSVPSIIPKRNSLRCWPKSMSMSGTARGTRITPITGLFLPSRTFGRSIRSV